MKLLLDLGNSRLKWALWDGRTLSPMQAAALDATDPLPRADAALLASSCRDPQRLQHLRRRLADAGIDIVDEVAAPRSDDLLRLAYAEPATLGVDRWLAMRAARRLCDGGFVVASVGTALTIDAVDRDGRHLGGCIAPGPDAMRAVLLARAPHLSDDGGQLVEFAASTIDAVHSGPWLAAAALIERLYRRAAARFDAAPRLLLLGGAVAPIAAALDISSDLLPDLVLRGMLTLGPASEPGVG